jgi:hypothetical protein
MDSAPHNIVHWYNEETTARYGQGLRFEFITHAKFVIKQIQEENHLAFKKLIEDRSMTNF